MAIGAIRAGAGAIRVMAGAGAIQVMAGAGVAIGAIRVMAGAIRAGAGVIRVMAGAILTMAMEDMHITAVEEVIMAIIIQIR